jgi:hypothetical protein
MARRRAFPTRGPLESAKARQRLDRADPEVKACLLSEPNSCSAYQVGDLFSFLRFMLYYLGLPVLSVNVEQ